VLVVAAALTFASPRLQDAAQEQQPAPPAAQSEQQSTPALPAPQSVAQTDPPQESAPPQPEQATPAQSPDQTPAALLPEPPQPPPQPSFADWLSGVRAEALDRGIRPEILDQAFAGLDQPLQFPLQQDKAQPEFVQTLEDYLSRHVTIAMILRGRLMMQQHRALLQRVSGAYGLPANILVAIWGVESNYGRGSGTQPTIPVLATLAWDPRRSDLFRKELLSALDILNRGDIESDKLKGSWAGAIGQPQFLPSSYLAYAVDFDGDGRRDLWNSTADVFASIANYLKQHGWQTGQRWGREVSVKPAAIADVPLRTGGGCRATRETRGPLPLDQWGALGVKLSGGRALPKGDDPASFASGTTRQFLVYANYDVLLSYNCAHTYALTVALLADRIGQ
jgi:membrane-bound lytic murein transglycosylase B